MFDARGANKYFGPRPFVMVIFTLFMLLDAMYLFCHGYAYSVDMRHYSYQWKLAAVMSWAFAVVVDKFVYLPKVLAMGYRDACVLAQAMSWVIVFRKPRPSAGDDPWPEEAEYCLPAGASSSASMPPFLWLRAELAAVASPSQALRMRIGARQR